MSNQSEDNMASRSAALVSFDRARDAYLAAFAQAPDEALPYVPPGDEYALGVLPMHLQDSMQHYMAVLDRVIQADFGPVDLSAEPERAPEAEASARRHAYLVAQRPIGADRPGMLAELARAHQQVTSRVAGLDEATFARQAPVVYSAGAAAYPTSCRDIMGWLTDHYQEHADQTKKILAQWRARAS
jgi:DinB superfamily